MPAEAEAEAGIDWYSSSSNDYFHEYHAGGATGGHVSAVDMGAGLISASGPLHCVLEGNTEVPLHLQPSQSTPSEESLSKYALVSSISARATLSEFQVLRQNARIRIERAIGERHYFVDLSDDLGCIKRKLRKSYRSLVNKQEGVIASHGIKAAKLMDDCRTIHLKVAGKKTRPEKTWELMGAAVQRDQAVLVTSEYEGTTLGYCYISHNGINGYYSSSAILERKGMHPLIWKAIEQCKKKGLKRLYMDIETAGVDRSVKEENISLFKRGFGLKAQDAMRFEIKRPSGEMRLFYQ
ncbi:hypothetical protein N9Z25_06670 [Luminiphilus sp.]|nr:hypothetical protein [Luminiphilus sp.]